MSVATEHLVQPGHRACAGCGLLVGARLATDATEGNVVIANATGCLEVTTTAYPQSAWRVPWIHSVFGNAAAVATGVSAGLRAQGKNVPVIAQAGDGGTADIGLQALSGMLERREDVLFICYDNEGYMNTGVQRSGLTPYHASTATTPVGERAFGNPLPKKDLISIVLAHSPAYVATATIAFQKDLDRKVRRALQTHGPRYLHILVPCPLGWRFEPRQTIAVSRLAVQSNMFPLAEWRDGVLGNVKGPASPVSVDEYLRPQGRFAHLFKDERGADARGEIQRIADSTARRFGIRPYTEPGPAARSPAATA
jgi:pyruvate ferredoxin oxidoreductase beta subunit